MFLFLIKLIQFHRNHLEGDIQKNGDATISIFLSQITYDAKVKLKHILDIMIVIVLARAMAVDNYWLWDIAMAMGNINGYGKKQWLCEIAMAMANSYDHI